MQNNLTLLSKVFEQVTDPRGKQGREHPLPALLALTFLGLLAGQNYFAPIQYRRVEGQQKWFDSEGSALRYK